VSEHVATLQKQCPKVGEYNVLSVQSCGDLFQTYQQSPPSYSSDAVLKNGLQTPSTSGVISHSFPLMPHDYNRTFHHLGRSLHTDMDSSYCCTYHTGMTHRPGDWYQQKGMLCRLHIVHCTTAGLVVYLDRYLRSQPRLERTALSVGSSKSQKMEVFLLSEMVVAFSQQLGSAR
jgi:hypothetical protein